MPHFFEGQIVFIAKSQIRGCQTWEQSARLKNLGIGHSSLCPHGLEAFDYIAVSSSALLAVGHQQIFPAVQVHVQEDRRPRPLGGLESAELGDLSIRAIAAIQKERV